jgi:hypothetical protein
MSIGGLLPIQTLWADQRELGNPTDYERLPEVNTDLTL